MKTFLSFIVGILLGGIAGSIGTVAILIGTPEAKEFLDMEIEDYERKVRED